MTFPPTSLPAASAGTDPAERRLFSFGPFGVSISRGRPSVWTKSMRNTIEVVLTTQRLCGVWNPKIFDWLTPKLDFESELGKSNVAVGIFLAGLFVGLGLLLGNAVK